MSLVKILILPPGVLIALLIVGWLLTVRRHRGGIPVLLAGIALLWILSTPLVGGALLNAVSLDATAFASENEPAAIVVLGGTFDDTEEGGAPGPLTLERLARAAALHRESGFPILVSAGKIKHLEENGATIMARSLRDVFGLKASWQETASTNTYDNALETARILQKSQIDRALVVTQSWHLRRAMYAFKETQLDAIPVAANGTSGVRKLKLRDLLPTLAGLEASYYALYETLGLLWYKIRY